MTNTTSTGNPISRRTFLRGAAASSVGLWAIGIAGCSSGGTGSGGGSSSAPSTGSVTGSGAGPSPTRSVSPANLAVSIWGSKASATLYQDNFDAYLASHPGTKISLQLTPSGSYLTKLNTAIAGGAAPSIFQMNNRSVAEYASRGVARAITDLIPNPLPLDQLPDSIFQSSIYGGKVYFVPLGLAVQPSIVYNYTALQKLGLGEPPKDWTYEQYQDFASKITSASGGKVYGSSDNGGQAEQLEAFVRGIGKNLFTDDGQLGISQDDLSTWFAYWDGMRKAKACVPSSMNANLNDFATSTIVKGQTVLYGTASNKGTNNLQLLMKDELRFTSPPQREANKPTGELVTPLGQFAISSKLSDEDAYAAASLCAFLITDKKAVEHFGLVQGVPLFPDLRKELYTSASTQDKAIYDSVDSLTTKGFAPRPPYPPGASAALDNLLELNQSVGFGKSSVKDAVSSFFDAANKALKK